MVFVEKQEEEVVVQLPGGKVASPPLKPGASMPSFRAMAAANVASPKPSQAPSNSPTVSASSTTANKKTGNGKVQFGGASTTGGSTTGSASAAGLNLPPRTHSAPPALEEEAVVVPVVKAVSVAPQQELASPQPMPPAAHPSAAAVPTGLMPHHPHPVPYNPHYAPQQHQQQHQQHHGGYPHPQHPQQQQYQGYPYPPNHYGVRPPMHQAPYGMPPMMRPPYDGSYMRPAYPPGPTGPGYITLRPGQPSSIPASPGSTIPQRVVKKIAIVNPETGEDVTKDLIIKSLNSPAGTSDAISSPSTEKKHAVVIVNPADNKPVDISKPIPASDKDKPIADNDKPVISTDKPIVPVMDDVFEMDDQSIFSGGELSDLESCDDLSDEEEEEEYTGPRLLKIGQHVEYPRTLVQFSPPSSADEVWKYDRSFLMQFRPICTWKPEMELEKVQKARVAAQAQGGQRRDYEGGRRDRRGGRDRQPNNLSGVTAVLTNRATNAWDRLGSVRLPEEEKLLREVKGMLNKLTLDKFDSISDKIIEMGIMSKTIMPGTIDLIFDKAVEEPKFASMYARLCLKIVMHENEEKVKADPALPNEDGSPAKIELEFRRFLISKCQVEYEKKKAWSSNRLAKLAADKDEPATPEEAKQRADEEARKAAGELTEEDYALIKVKRRVLGNMRFIGELFNVGLLPEKIMHAVIVELLRNVSDPEEEEVESFCRLFTTVGPKLDTVAAQRQIESYLGRMTQLTTNTVLSTRVRFMILDVLDLRKVKWAGKDREMPKTLADFQRELAEKQAQMAASRSSRPAGSRDARDARGDRPGSVRPDQRPGSARPSLHYQSSGGNASSTSVSSREDHHSRRRDPPPPLRQDRRGGGGQSSGGFQTVSSSRGSPALRATTPQMDNRPASTASASTTGSAAQNRYDLLMAESHAAESAEATPASTPTAPVAPWEEAKALSQLQSAFNELMRFKKLDDFVAIWTEIIPTGHHKEALNKLLGLSLDSGEKAVEALGQQVFPSSIKFDRAAVLQVFTETMGMLDDLAVDLPRAPEYAGKLMAAAIDAGMLHPDCPMSVLSAVAKRDAVPAVRALVHCVGALKEQTAKSSPAVISVLREHLSTAAPAILRAKLLPRFGPAMQAAVIRARLSALPAPYEEFLQAARQLALDDFSLADLDDQSIVLEAISSAAFDRLHTETKTSASKIDAKLPTMLTCLSIFEKLSPTEAAMTLLNTLTTGFQAVDLDWFERCFKATHAAGLVQAEDLAAWRKDGSLDKTKALERLSAFIDSAK